MTDHDTAIELAKKITAKAEAALHPLVREMTVMNWPPEFRAIMWETVAELAAKHAKLHLDEPTASPGPSRGVVDDVKPDHRSDPPVLDGTGAFVRRNNQP